ncbi:hypothetical protein AFCDBAGC_3017 [Methylobacterium cerastii]|uniref:Uncharacterized protein n=1 Tax=Methylobacterium cerastii TaxID=932741 RepID=A0ABQ4QIS1_9HYPH|nr:MULTISPECIES: hypothetical protein [Methylobacterium]GJD45148.1 hypothetical protein AFCDBAGC_3017 [Methylobacterium cerastii]
MPHASQKAILVLGGLLCLLAPIGPAAAQSTGYVTGFPGKDPAGDDEIGWGPAYRPETSFSQPGTPPTPGDFAGAAYRARTGRGPYDNLQNTSGARPIAVRSGKDYARPSRRVVRSRHRVGRTATVRSPSRRATRQADR